MINIVKVLLTATIESLGHVGEVVEVAEGYARNYLFPQKLATQPTPHNAARYAKQKAAHEADLQERKANALRLRAVLADQTLVFVRKAHDDNRLYGSVRVDDIISKLEEDFNEHIEPSRVQLTQAIETLGPHTVTLHLYKDITVEIRIRVDSESKEGSEEP